MQTEGENTVCKLCFRSCEQGFEDVEAVTIEMLRNLRLALHLDVSGRPVICKTCSENIQKCFDFKTMCLYTEDCINSFRDDRNNVKLDLREIYLTKPENKNIALSKCHAICRLCMEIVDSNCRVSLNRETKDLILTKTILQRYFSELDLDITKDPGVCASCNDSLHNYFTFVTNCLDVKSEIKNCCKIEGSNSNNQVKSDGELQLAPKNQSHYENAYPDIDILKNSIENELYHETEVKVENIVQEKFQEWQTKEEVNEREAVGDTIRGIVEECHEDKQNDEIKLKYENFVDVENYEFNIKHEEINIKIEEEDTDRFQNNMLIHKNFSEVRMYPCEVCTYKAKYRNNLKTHMLIHKNASEVTMYSCELCTYKAKQKGNLKLHMLIHKNDSDVTIYSCEICTYKTKYKSSLKLHVLTHKNAAEATLYSCEICTYKTKRKSSINRHMLIHKNASEVTTYACELCTYKAKEKSNLKKHMLIHKSASEVTMYSCEKCMYKAKYKGSIKLHMLIHRDPSEGTMFSCQICTYKAKHKNSLNNHMLWHKNASKETMHSCEICTYKAERKSTIKQHMLSHRNISEVTVYSCEVCTYKTKHKCSLKTHMLIHKDASEVTLYSCELCTCKTKYKSSLKKHMLTHTNASK